MGTKKRWADFAVDDGVIRSMEARKDIRGGGRR